MTISRSRTATLASGACSPFAVGIRWKTIALVAAVVAVFALPASAASAKRTVPSYFFGANYDVWLGAGASPAAQEAHFSRMATIGSETVRVAFLWYDAQPSKGGKFTFRQSDPLVKMAALHGQSVLPVVVYAPRWARKYPDKGASPPRNNNEYAAYLKALVKRYGPKGTFWNENRKVPKMPVRTWQVWNEPNMNYQYTIPKGQDYGPMYAAQLRASYKAIKATDKTAVVVLPGLANQPAKALAHLYANHIHGYFDVAAAHPYTTTAKGILKFVKDTRDQMRKYGDSKKQLWLTELGLPASRGRAHSDSHLQTNDAGMAKFLRETYYLLAKNIRTYHIGRVYWYTWASTYSDKGPAIFDYAGLLKWRPNKPAERKPAYTEYQKAAKALEGCAKTNTARCK